MTLHYQPVNNRSETESFRLLSISESSTEDENLTKDKKAKSKTQIEDLKLNIPIGNSNTTSSKMNRIRRKIRLKRKQRDRLSNGVHLNINQNSSTSETGGSELEAGDEYCSPMDVCLACMPNNAINSFCSRCCCRGRSRAHRQLWLNAFILFIFAVALASLAYYTMTLQNQLAILSIHLDPVLDDKSTLKKSQEEMQNKLNSVVANQSILHDNLSSIQNRMENLSNQVSILNGSISSALANLANAPELKDVPEKLVKFNEKLGQFGSHLTDVESQIKETKNDVLKVQDSFKELPKISNDPNDATSQVDKSELQTLTLQFDSKLHNETVKLDEKIDEATKNFKILGTNLTEQLQKQEIHAAKSWKFLEDLNTNLQNVSVKAASNELVSRNNQAEIAKLRQSNNSGSLPNNYDENHLN